MKYVKLNAYIMWRVCVYKLLYIQTSHIFTHNYNSQVHLMKFDDIAIYYLFHCHRQHLYIPVLPPKLIDYCRWVFIMKTMEQFGLQKGKYQLLCMCVYVRRACACVFVCINRYLVSRNYIIYYFSCWRFGFCNQLSTVYCYCTTNLFN